MTFDRRSLPRSIWLLAPILLACGQGAPTEPTGLRRPVLGPTTFIDPDVLTASDPTTLVALVPTGQESRTVFDGRVGQDVTIDAHLFEASFDDSLSVEVRVNPEYSDSVAAELAQAYATDLGRLPTALRAEVTGLVIHDGDEPFAARDGAIVVHVARAVRYFIDGFLEEAFVPEAVRISLQDAHGGSEGWLEAQEFDNGFISERAQANPETEDLAESFIPFIVVIYKPDRVTNFLGGLIVSQIPARLTYLDEQDFDMHPLVAP